MKVLGIDPGLKATGYGVVEFERKQNSKIKLLEAGTIEPNQKDLLENRINKVYKYLGELIEQHQPDVMVLEKLYAHYKHPVTACKLGHVRGVICLLCSHRKIKLAEYSVKRIRKALLGNGNASKQQTQSAVAYVLKIDEKRLTLDASDALALALGFIQIQTRSFGPSPSDR